MCFRKTYTMKNKITKNNETSVLIRISVKVKDDWKKKKGGLSYRLWVEEKLYGKTKSGTESSS